jgi:GTP-binding protein
MFLDYAKILVKGGAGGDGCNSLYTDIFNRMGVPDGGNGGDGGSVILRSDSNLSTLYDFKFIKHFEGENGRRGGTNNKYGRRGKPKVVKVPVGTLVKDQETGLVVKDFTASDEEVIVASGGKGGRGNGVSKKTAFKGELGEERKLILELKVMADVGLIGFPNAGKSTLISAISRVQSKIAAYPFTTKEPRLGVVTYADNVFVVADMPGLIEGAHAGRGLGDRFLRHIERTLVLVHLVDIVPADDTDPFANYEKIEEELKLYSEEVFAKPRIIVASKMDLTGAKEALEKFRGKVPGEVIAISAATHQGLDELIKKMYETIVEAKARKVEEASPEEGFFGFRMEDLYEDEKNSDKDRDEGPDGGRE